LPPPQHVVVGPWVFFLNLRCRNAVSQKMEVQELCSLASNGTLTTDYYYHYHHRHHHHYYYIILQYYIIIYF